MNEEQQQQNEEHRQMKIHIKYEQQQRNLTGGSPKQSPIAGSFGLKTIKRKILEYKRFKILKNLFSLLKLYKITFFLRIQ